MNHGGQLELTDSASTLNAKKQTDMKISTHIVLDGCVKIGDENFTDYGVIIPL